MNCMLEDGAYLPEKAHEADAGYDLRTHIPVKIPAGGSATIDTGIHIAIPEGFFGKLESKSGLNVKHHIVSLGGVIDAGYTGSIVVKLYNLGKQDYIFQTGERLNLCVDCDNASCSFSDKIISDCPKYHCDRTAYGYENCNNCAFIQKYQEIMRDFYRKKGGHK